MPHTLSNYKGASIYKPGFGLPNICPTFEYASDKRARLEEPKNGQQDKISYQTDLQQTLNIATNDQVLEEKVANELPTCKSHGNPESKNIHRNDVKGCTNSSGLVWAKLHTDEWNIQNNVSVSTGQSSNYSNSGEQHPSYKAYSRFPKRKYMKQRRFAIDLGRRARVLGRFLQNIEEEEDIIDIDMEDCDYKP